MWICYLEDVGCGILYFYDLKRVRCEVGGLLINRVTHVVNLTQLCLKNYCRIPCLFSPVRAL